MANVTTTARAKLVQATEATIYNLSMPAANTEYSQALSDGTKKITIRMRVKGKARIAFVMNGTTTSYITLEGGSVYSEENLDLNGATIYVQSNVSGQTAEILQWV